MPMCVECKFSAVRHPATGSKMDAATQVMAKHGFVNCTSSPFRATYYHPTRERKCDRFDGHGDAEKTARRLVLFGEKRHAVTQEAT